MCGSLLVRKSYKGAVIELSGRHLTLKISPKQVPPPSVPQSTLDTPVLQATAHGLRWLQTAAVA